MEGETTPSEAPKKRLSVREHLPWFVPAAALLSGMVLGALGVALVAAGTIYDYRDSADPEKLGHEPYDVIVVLAGARGRIEAAADIWIEYRRQMPPGSQPPILYIAGMGRRADWTVLESQIRPEVLATIPKEKVVLETESGDTRGNATVFRQWARRVHSEHMLLVTSSYHMKRSQFTFERVLRKSPVEFRTLSVYQPPFTSDRWRSSVYGVQVTLIEYLKWIYYLASL
ncbi:MAG TPA: YdcF family protein [Bdellovibrionota bacterium]|jgi:uncharacterized SAM-binding protein YcdF (DUF218 family)|nr:YdcF family protein [Bdellovibrionota bacterium]